MTYRPYAAILPLVEALWWFIENVSSDSPERTDIFFDLRARFREHQETEQLYKELKPGVDEDMLKAVKSLISDIESMKISDPYDATVPSASNWFGPFSEQVGNDLDTNVEWPNLAISVAAVKALLEPKTIEGELTKSQIVKQHAEARGMRVIETTFENASFEDLMGLPTLKGIVK